MEKNFTQKRIQETVGKISATSAFDTFDRMAGKVEQLEAEADAVEELAQLEAEGPDTLESQFKELENKTASSDADALLEDLKSKMAKLEDKSSSKNDKN